MKIGPHDISPASPPLIVAEVGFNHNGNARLACEMAAAAARSGCAAAKYQAFHGPELFSPRFTARRDDGTTWCPAEFYSQYELTDEEYEEVAAACREHRILFLCTPFDLQAAKMLDELAVPAFKIASGDLRHEALIRACAATGRPMIISTGMGRLADVENALRFCEAEGNHQVLLLHCTSSYPCKPEDVHLRAMVLLRDTFGTPVGLSDHTLDNAAAIGAVALGAAMIEKHFTTDRNLPGFDQAMSADPPAMKSLVESCNAVHASLGEARKIERDSEAGMRHFGQRSVVYATDLPAGTVLTAEHLGAKRPAVGIGAQHCGLFVGETLRTAVQKDDFAKWEDLGKR